MRTRSDERRMPARRADGGAQDACDFPGFLQQGRVFLDSAVLEEFEPVDALVGLFERDMQFRSKCRTRSALAGSSIVRPDRGRGSQKLTPGVLCLGIRRQPTIEAQHGQRKVACSFDEIPRRHGSRSRASGVPRENVSKSVQYFCNFALSDFPLNFVLRTFYFLPGRPHG
jgi:hypothetical protein